MKITFLGASHEVTGSHYLVELKSGEKIIVDCGLFQGSRLAEDKNYADFDYDPRSIKLVLITHAHLDHTGRLPKLYADGCQAPVYSIEATRDLTRIVLEDSAELLSEEAERENHPPLYQPTDVVKVFTNWQLAEYDKTFQPLPNVSVVYTDAGHILGSSSITIMADDQTITFSGDLGNEHVPLLQPTQPVKKADILVIESTYGGRLHEPSDNRAELLTQVIKEIADSKGTLMIPAFAIERTQELLYEINDLVESKKIPAIPVYLDSPMAIKVTRVFRRYQDLYNKEDAQKAKLDDLFSFPGLHLAQTVQLSKEINHINGPKIVIAGAGMMHGGRILHHALRYLPDPASHLLIVGYQVEGSLGRQLYDGERTVKVLGETIHVRAKVQAINSYSAHADQAALLKFISEIKEKPKQIFITHGEFEQSKELGRKIQQEFSIKTTVPDLEESFNL